MVHELPTVIRNKSIIDDLGHPRWKAVLAFNKRLFPLSVNYLSYPIRPFSDTNSYNYINIASL